MHVTSAAGTDLRVNLKHGDKQAVVGGVWGFCPKPGMVSHWPAGLALAFPAAGSVNGTLVMAPGDVNLTFKSYLRDTIRLTIENDSVVAIEGQGVDVDMMRGYWKAWEDAEGHRAAYAVSHVGFGLNPAARWDAMAFYDKRDCNGTELRAFAGNFLYSTGANEVAGRHTLGHFDSAHARLHHSARRHGGGRCGPSRERGAGMSAPAFTEAGLPTQPAVVFLHGVGGGRHGWAAQQAHVAALGWRSLAWDMPGYGDSPMVTPYDFAHLAQALWQMLDAAHIDQAVLVGHSMGAMVALQAWTQKPERIRGLLLAASSPAFGNSDGDFQKQFLAQRLAPLEAGKTMGDIADKLIPTMAAPGGDAAHTIPANLKSAHQSMSAVPPATYRAALHALVQFEQRAALPTLTVPVLCLAAEHDRTAPPTVMERMAQKIPGARYACLAGAGHLLHYEQPEAFNAELEKFLKDVKP